MPEVSVIIPVYNGSRWIGQALRSLFDQTYKSFEVIVIDDGSTDDLPRAIREWSDRIVLERQPNGGPGSARNRGLRRARGRLIAFLDADDEWLPEKLALQVAYFDKYPQTGLLHTATVGDHLPASVERASEFPPPTEAFSGLFHTDFFIQTLTVMAPRAVLLEAGGFDERREIHVEDWDLWLRVAARHPVGYLPRRLALHRKGGRMSAAVEKTYAGQARVIEKHRELIARACTRHRGVPGRCLRERYYVLHWAWGYERFRLGDRVGARHEFARAIAATPSRASAYLRYLACFVPSGWISRGRSLRKRIGTVLAGPRPRAASVPVGPLERATIAGDTVYRRTRRKVARIVHSADDAITRATRTRRRVLFEAASPMSFGLFNPIYRRLSTDPRIEFWFTAPGRAWRPEAIFASVGIRDRVISASRARWQKWDLCVNTDFFEMSNLRRRTTRVHLFHGVAGKYGLDAPLEFAREVASFACLMFPNDDRRRRYVEAGLVADDPTTAALVGYPKLDALVDGSLDRLAISRDMHLTPNRPVVMYAPTWSPHSSLNAMGEDIITELAAAGYQVIVKLHDRSYDRQHRGSGGIDWAERLSSYRSHPLVRVVRSADATPCLFVADALVTDHSSIGFEFMLLDRPLVVIDCPELIVRSRVNVEKVAQLRAAADVVHSARDAAAAVEAGLADRTRHGSARRRTAEDMFYRAGTATDRAVALLYHFLELPAPVAAEVNRTETVFVSAIPS